MAEKDADQNLLSAFMYELVTSPINLGLLGLCCFLLYKIIRGRNVNDSGPPPEPQLKPLKRQDMNLAQLRQYDGNNEEGRICIAVNGKIFDVTRGKRFYGAGGPYGIFAGRDASRALGTFTFPEVFKEEDDDLSDLNSTQMESIREWEMQFTEKYDHVGRLLKSGEHPRDYSDTEEEHSIHDKKEH